MPMNNKFMCQKDFFFDIIFLDFFKYAVKKSHDSPILVKIVKSIHIIALYITCSVYLALHEYMLQIQLHNHNHISKR